MGKEEKKRKSWGRDPPLRHHSQGDCVLHVCVPEKREGNDRGSFSPAAEKGKKRIKNAARRWGFVRSLLTIHGGGGKEEKK